MAAELADQHKMEYFETSAKMRTNIDDVMQHIMTLVYNKMFKPTLEMSGSHGGGAHEKNNDSIVIGNKNHQSESQR